MTFLVKTSVVRRTKRREEEKAKKEKGERKKEKGKRVSTVLSVGDVGISKENAES